jgi:hypothetical protein
MQPRRERGERKRKEKKGNERKKAFLLLSFVFIYFSESGLFKGLWAKKIKKIPVLPTRGSGCGRERFQTIRSLPLARLVPGGGCSFAHGNFIGP